MITAPSNLFAYYVDENGNVDRVPIVGFLYDEKETAWIAQVCGRNGYVESVWSNAVPGEYDFAGAGQLNTRQADDYRKARGIDVSYERVRVAEAAKILGVTRARVQQLKSELDARKENGVWMYSMDRLRERAARAK